MRLFFISSIVFILSACSNSTIKLSKGEEIFVDGIFEKTETIQTENHIVFVLNQSFCAPCEEEVKRFYSQKFGGYKKLFVVPSNRKPIADESKNYISFDYSDLARYGVVRANGAVMVFKNGKCVLLESIDVQHIDILNNHIESMTRN